MRVEANVSIRPAGSEAYGTRTEVKNMNSFRAVERAIAHEIQRQSRALEAGEVLVQETRGWDDVRNETYTMRVKEDSDDYRYFPEPDLPPLRTDPAWLETIGLSLPELPSARRARYVSALGLSPYDAGIIVADVAASALFEDALVAAGGQSAGVRPVPKALANWVTGEYPRILKTCADGGHASGAELVRLVAMVENGRLSGTNAKEVFARHVETGEPVERIVSDFGLSQISDEGALMAAIDAVLAANETAVSDYRTGKPQAVGFLVGQVMKATRGQANAAMVQRLIHQRLENGG
jgi:aspartyl-tRNA(Asn)/glutamyl-tRNA(Gln) amidotransferase subunit B